MIAAAAAPGTASSGARSRYTEAAMSATGEGREDGQGGGAPASIEATVRRVLEGLGAPYQIVEIDPAFADTAAFCEKYGYGLAESGNTIVVVSKKEPRQFAACLVLANTRLDVNHAVRRRLGASRVSFASAEETMALTGMAIGGVTVLALPPGLPIYVDDRVMALESVILGSGSRASKVRIAPAALRRLPGVEVVAGLAQPAG
jgi:prolyl-tRNA editing enzyme YbaK/EbsC (Cys-tRNA(Pro) deacylase)